MDPPDDKQPGYCIHQKLGTCTSRPWIRHLLAHGPLTADTADATYVPRKDPPSEPTLWHID